ncbi:hypothetical protein [Desulfovibrio sp. TomC]|uniref:hypothetical protein n=1 Tax=Desulfovibrio sp. TomC TaxID=1562888 RepID=UPI00057468C6|nr:hypothetical protein [Desulfovibrio sp. TomC]KHK01922.1 hypothetical protein NY78_2741 [Desulfovibrio sp. TomC]
MAAPFAVLWDHSHLWGLLLCRGLAALGVDFAPVTCAAVAGGALAGDPPRALLVPGGFARRKFAALGPAGVAAIRGYVADGGTYFGVCGGCGLALTHPEGLALCSWTRRPFADRLEHLVSGHVRLAVAEETPFFPAAAPREVEVPVWWPAGFVPPPGEQRAAGDAVSVVAAYAGAGADLMLADIALGAMPQGLLGACQERFGLTLTPEFLDGGACVIAGAFGRGRYVLSHAHLETPDSPRANAWLAHLLRLFAPEAEIAGEAVPAWDPAGEPERFADPHLGAVRRDLESVISAGIDSRLLLQRNAWLLGWRPGMPGFSLSNLAAMLAGAAALPPTEAALDYWRQAGPEFARLADGFARRLETFFPAQRLEITLSLVERRVGIEPNLAAERRELFGASPGGGGLCGQLAERLDGLLLRLLA